MSAFTKAWLLIAALVLASSMARSDGLGNYGILGQPIFGGIGGLGQGSGVAPPAGNDALLVDNASPALLVDNTNPACLVGGC